MGLSVTLVLLSVNERIFKKVECAQPYLQVDLTILAWLAWKLIIFHVVEKKDKFIYSLPVIYTMLPLSTSAGMSLLNGSLSRMTAELYPTRRVASRTFIPVIWDSN